MLERTYVLKVLALVSEKSLSLFVYSVFVQACLLAYVCACAHACVHACVCFNNLLEFQEYTVRPGSVPVVTTGSHCAR